VGKVAKYDKKDLEVGDRICMLKGSPIKEGTVRQFDEEQACVLFDDMTFGWVHLGHFYITLKGSEMTIEGMTWLEFQNRRREESQ
jgi:hypothetical protein